MKRIFKLLSIAFGIALLAVGYILMISFLKHSKTDPTQYTEQTDNNVQTPSYIDYLSSTYEDPETTAEVHMPEPSKARQKKAPRLSGAQKNKAKGDIHTRTLVSASELKKTKGLRNEKLPKEFHDKVAAIQWVSQTSNGALSYGDASTRGKIVLELKKKQYEVEVDSSGNITGWMGSYRVVIKHTP